nr:hypothetical protein Iba_chr12cCG13320 [Ipomoea batatas]
MLSTAFSGRSDHLWRQQHEARGLEVSIEISPSNGNPPSMYKSRSDMDISPEERSEAPKRAFKLFRAIQSTVAVEGFNSDEFPAVQPLQQENSAATEVCVPQQFDNEKRRPRRSGVELRQQRGLCTQVGTHSPAVSSIPRSDGCPTWLADSTMVALVAVMVEAMVEWRVRFRIAEFSLQVFQLQNFKGQIKHHLPRHEALYLCNSMAAPSSTPLAVLDNLRRPFPAAAQNS